MKKAILLSNIIVTLLYSQLPIFRPFFSTIDGNKLFFYEVINLVSEDTTKSRVDINFRIANDLLTFVRDPLQTTRYVANFIVVAEILDKDEKSVARKVFKGHRVTDKYEETNSKDIYTQGNFRFDLNPGNYRLVLTFEDEESKQIIKRERNISLRPLKPRHFETSDLTIIQEISRNGDTLILTPTNIGNRVNFGKGFVAYIQFTDKPIEVNYTLLFFHEFGRKKEIKKGIVKPEEITNDKMFLFKENPGDTLFTYLLIPSPLQVYYSLLIMFSGDSLDLGEYEIIISAKFKDVSEKEIQKSFTRKFTVEWIDMPSSLQNLDYAIEILDYIATPNEMAKLRFGTPQARLLKLKEFWAQRDPTPKTLYNELMAEYYRRVDYAYINFATIRDQDGARTDRGKIYILYGEPTKIERKYTPGKPTEEIWYYETIKRKFVFVDQFGSFKLIAVETYAP